MAANTGVNFMNDFATQEQSIDRQRKLAELLQTEGMQSPEGQMISGHYVPPSMMQNVARLAQGLSGQNMQARLDQQQSDLAQRSTQTLVDGLTSYQNAKPEGRQVALAELLRSGHPALQQLAMTEMTKKADNPFGKVDPKDYTQESVAKFAASGNFADLVPVRKKELFGDTAVDPYEVKNGQTFKKAPEGFRYNAAGMLEVDPTWLQVKKDIAKSGKTDVNIKTEVKTGESLAAQVGPMMKDSTSIAEGAVKQVDAARRVIQAVDSGKIVAGPGASTHLRLAQIGDSMGVGGKDNAEKIANTRQAIRGMAELTLQGRQQMKGQGAITESEGALAEKAMSGNIDDLTPAEIKQLAKASERSARFNYSEHQRKLKVMQANPALGAIAPFYQGPAMPAEAPDAPVVQPAATPINGFSIRRLP